MRSFVKDCEVRFIPELELSNNEKLLDRLIYNVNWLYPKMRGNSILRGVCSMGVPYSYSGITVPVYNFDPVVFALMRKINDTLNKNYNACLLNYYKDGSVGISKHSDDESELVSPVTVATISLGATRTFKLRNKISGDYVDIKLFGGSVLLMGENCQDLYTHEIIKEKCNKPRISLTFREFYV